MKRNIGLAIVILAGFLLAAYAGDYLLLRYRVAQNRQAFGTVMVYRYYAVEEKNHKTEYVSANSEAQTCVRSAFPHLGYSPCWYLSRHTDQRIDM